MYSLTGERALALFLFYQLSPLSVRALCSLSPPLSPS